MEMNCKRYRKFREIKRKRKEDVTKLDLRFFKEVKRQLEKGFFTLTKDGIDERFNMWIWHRRKAVKEYFRTQAQNLCLRSSQRNNKR